MWAKRTARGIMTGGVDFVVSHLPHIVPPIIGMFFLFRFAMYLRRLPPAHLNDEELAAWHAEHSRK